MRYADPSVCPDCREELPSGASRCPHCDLPVRHPLAQQLFGALTRADELIAQLRREVPAPVPQPVPAPPTPAAAPAPPAPAATADAVPPPSPPGPQPAAAPTGMPATGSMPFASVPKILLGLGALCLLVAAVIFLAVSWSLLGVGGRTAVLLGLTLGAGSVAVLMHRHELRIAAEALSSVCLGLIALDVMGAESAGWLGDISGSGLALVVGLVVTAVGTGFAAATRPHLGAPQVAAGIGVLIGWTGLSGLTSHDLIAGHLSLAVIGGGIWACHRIGLTVEKWSLLVVGGLGWCIIALYATGLSLDDPTLRAMWLDDGTGWSLLVSAAALLVPGAALHKSRLLVAGGAGATLLASAALAGPAVDESARVFGIVALLATAVWTGVVAALPVRLRAIAITPAGAGSLVLIGIVLVTATVGILRWERIGAPFTADFGATFSRPGPVTEPLVAAPAVALIVTLLTLSLRRGRISAWLAHGGIATGVAALATLASYDVPLAVVSGTTALLALAALALAFTAATDGHRLGHGVTALLLAGGGCLVALPSAAQSAIAAAVATAVAATLHVVSRSVTVRQLGGLGIAPAAALTLWSGAEAFEVDRGWVGVPVLLLVGVLAIVRPRPEVEVPAVLVALLAFAIAVPAANDVGGSLALHLAVLGALVAATALINESRRNLVWVGLGVLVLASWVRLADLQVTAPEPYTLPLALALTGAGLWHLHRHPHAGTLLALLPGLALATVPSLLWVLADPVSVRALVLGAACVALTIAGAVLRWSAPLLVGAVVGALLVLRELGPYAEAWPQWVWIGLAGTLLTVVGITWERQLRELRKAVGYLGRLR